MQREALRRELLDRELDGAVAVPARALDRDRLLRQLLQREVWESVELALDEQRPAAALQRVDAEQDRHGSRARGAVEHDVHALSVRQLEHALERILGVDVDRIIGWSFFISSALGGAAGVLFGLAFNSVSPDVGRSIELKGLAVIILGGMGSVAGAVIAGFAVGIIEVFTVAQIGSSYRDAVSFGVLFLILLVRPRGLLGHIATREA
jgi:hypothetical protein